MKILRNAFNSLGLVVLLLLQSNFLSSYIAPCQNTMNFQVNMAGKPHAFVTSPTKNPTKMTVNQSFLKDKKKIYSSRDKSGQDIQLTLGRREAERSNWRFIP